MVELLVSMGCTVEESFMDELVYRICGCDRTLPTKIKLAHFAISTFPHFHINPESPWIKSIPPNYKPVIDTVLESALVRRAKLLSLIQ
jgi:hypothetical protein